MTFQVPSQRRLDDRACAAIGADPSYGTSDAFGNYGMFLLPPVIGNRRLLTLASEGEGWEHVSVSIVARKVATPTWVEMCAVKDAFWGPEDVVMQLHPRRSEYVNHHEACLHLWRPVGGGEGGGGKLGSIPAIPEPPANLVGPKADA